MHIRPIPFACMRSVCSNEPSTTSALPPIRFCSAAVPDAKATDSTSRPSCSKYLRFSATKYAILFIWLIEPPTESEMWVFSSFGAWAPAACAASKAAVNTNQPVRFIQFPPRFLLSKFVRRRQAPQAPQAPARRTTVFRALARQLCRDHAHAALHVRRHTVVAHHL